MLDKLLEFEEKSEITKYKFVFNDEMIWPYFRAMIYNKAFLSNNNSISRSFHTFKEKSWWKKLFSKNPFSANEGDILFIQSSSSFINTFDGKYHNKIVDYYACIYKDKTIKIEFEGIQEHPKDRIFSNVKYFEIIDQIIKIQCKIHEKDVYEKDIHTAEDFINTLKNQFIEKFEEGFYFGLKKQIINMSVAIRYYYYYYEKLIKQIKPKVIFVDNGCYGGQRACLLRIANKQGITTGEFQHGYIGENNLIYNYPQSFINNKEYKEYLPQYFLAMGEYFIRGIKLPINKVVIGNPHLYTQLNMERHEVTKNNILIISDWVQRDNYVKLVEEFCKQDKENKYRIIFRIHPSDKNNKYLYSELDKYQNVIISEKNDLYDDIKRSEIIVGCYSTAIFECIPFNKKIMILKNEFTDKYMDKNIGTWFTDGIELFNSINNTKCIKTYDSEYYWNSNWKENYINFIKNVVYKSKQH